MLLVEKIKIHPFENEWNTLLLLRYFKTLTLTKYVLLNVIEDKRVQSYV